MSADAGGLQTGLEEAGSPEECLWAVGGNPNKNAGKHLWWVMELLLGQTGELGKGELNKVQEE